MNKFKVGDRVKYTSDAHSERESNPLWGGDHGYIGGTTTLGSSYGSCRVTWDNGGENYYEDTDLELLDDSTDEKPEKVKLTKRGKKVVEDYFLGKGKWARKDAEDGELKHGDRVSCNIYNHDEDETYHIGSAGISIGSDGSHICHDCEYCDGHEAEDMLDYNFSWNFDISNPAVRGVTNIKKI